MIQKHHTNHTHISRIRVNTQKEAAISFEKIT